VTLPTSGAITTAQIAQELYGDSTRLVAIPSADTRALVGKLVGPLVFPTDFYGKSIATEITIVEGGSSVDVYAQGYSDGSSGLGSFGSINPTNAAAIAGQLTSTGNARIKEIIHSGDRAVSSPSTIRLRVEGTYSIASLPFTTMTVSNSPDTPNTVVLNKANATVANTGGTTIVTWPSPGWPGMNKVAFT
tara:strand:- start:167 stop:736 length:570 start_codon:yes stop_codon:yes gene_type:complete